MNIEELQSEQACILLRWWQKSLQAVSSREFYNCLAEAARQLTMSEEASVTVVKGDWVSFVGSTRQGTAQGKPVAIKLGTSIPGKVALDGKPRTMVRGTYVGPDEEDVVAGQMGKPSTVSMLCLHKVNSRCHSPHFHTKVIALQLWHCRMKHFFPLYIINLHKLNILLFHS